MTSHLTDLAYLYGKPEITGTIKTLPEDFIVKESLSFEPVGEGNHLYLYITKTSLNTHDVIQLLSKHFSVSMKDIGYAGMKDKHAITSQWFSIPANNPDDQLERIETFNAATIEKFTCSNKKLKRGVIKSNYFKLIVRGFSADTTLLNSLLEEINICGVPNYFTEQRFGVNDKNILRAEKILTGKMRERNKQKCGLYYSAARSYLFNLLLAKRIEDKLWDKIQPGDVLMLNDTRSVFLADEASTDLQARWQANDLDIALPMAGKGGMQGAGYHDTLVNDVFSRHKELCQGLVNAGLEQQQRRMRTIPENFSWYYDQHQQTLMLEFSLPSGSYATAVLREIVRPTIKDTLE